MFHPKNPEAPVTSNFFIEIIAFYFSPERDGKDLAQRSRNQFSSVKAGDCFGKDPRNDTGYAFNDIWYVVIASEAKQSSSHKQAVPPDKGQIEL